jgi:hypothetical protein
MPKNKPDAATDSDAYLTAWAKQLAKSVTASELAKLVKDYRQQARNSRRSAADREFARKRAKALAGIRKLNS